MAGGGNDGGRTHAEQAAYAPKVPGNWIDVDPGNVQEALDALAAGGVGGVQVIRIEWGPGAGPFSATTVPPTGAVALFAQNYSTTPANAGSGYQLGDASDVDRYMAAGDYDPTPASPNRDEFAPIDITMPALVPQVRVPANVAGAGVTLLYYAVPRT